MSWSGHDAGLLLSSAKDNRTILWDVATGETLGELSAGDNWDFDVLWSPNNPGVFATSSYGAGEGNSGKVSLPSGTVFQQLLLRCVTTFSCSFCSCSSCNPMRLFSRSCCLLLLPFGCLPCPLMLLPSGSCCRLLTLPTAPPSNAGANTVVFFSQACCATGSS